MSDERIENTENTPPDAERSEVENKNKKILPQCLPNPVRAEDFIPGRG